MPFRPRLPTPAQSPARHRPRRRESTNTRHRYVEANLEMKEKALARLEAPDIQLKRFRADDDLMKSIQTL